MNKELKKEAREDWDKYIKCSKCQEAFDYNCPCQINMREFLRLIDKATLAERERILSLLPKRKKVYKHLDGSIVCSLCEKTEDEGCEHDWNAAIEAISQAILNQQDDE